jgi:hypothetical protein
MHMCCYAMQRCGWQGGGREGARRAWVGERDAGRTVWMAVKALGVPDTRATRDAPRMTRHKPTRSQNLDLGSGSPGSMVT